MAGQVEAGGLPLHVQQLRFGKLGQVGQRHLTGMLVLLHAAEQIHLALQIFLPGSGDAVHHRVQHLEQLAPFGPHVVKGAAADQILQGPPVQVPLEHPVTEVLEGTECSALFPLRHHLVDEAPADPLDRHQAEPNPLRHHGEVGAGLVHIRR